MELRQTDGRLAIMFRVVPVIFILFLAANVLALVVLGSIGGTASGERLQVDFTTSCPTEAAAIMQARADGMGLGDPLWTVEGDRVRLTATMPGLEDDATAVPALLARPGRLEVRHGSRVLATEADLTDVVMDMDEAGMPFTNLSFGTDSLERLRLAVEGDLQGSLDFYMDGELLAERPNSIHVTDESLKVIAGPGTTKERMRRAADRTFVLDNGAHPCPVSVASVEAAR